MEEQAIVMPEPKLKIENDQFRFEGDLIPVKINDGYDSTYDCLCEAGVYNHKRHYCIGVHAFYDGFSIKERLGEVDEALAVVDRKRLESDLDEKGYAFLTSKENPGRFKDYQNKGFMTNMDRIVQDLAYQKLSGELGFGVRHLKSQEYAELIDFDNYFRVVASDYWMENLEIIQKLLVYPVSFYKIINDKLKGVTVSDPEIFVSTETDSVWSIFGDWDQKHNDVNFVGGLEWENVSVAALKKVEPRKVV